MAVSVAHTQITTLSMSGRVTDADGEVIGATVVAAHLPTGTRYGMVANTEAGSVLPECAWMACTRLKFRLDTKRTLRKYHAPIGREIYAQRIHQKLTIINNLQKYG